MTKLEVRRIDGQLAVMIPEDLAARLGLGGLLELAAVETPAGLTLAGDTAVQAQVAQAQDVMARYRNALRELAK